MAFELLPWILDQEGIFQRIDYHWKPVDLFTETQAQQLMEDLSTRYDNLASAQSELASLDRAEKYLTLLRRMGFNVRRAKFSRRSNQLTFVRAIADFYSDYGTVLRFLKIDQLRGELPESPSPALA